VPINGRRHIPLRRSLSILKASNDADYPSVKTGTANGEQVVGTSGRALIKCPAGGDTLFGIGADDKLEGGDGNDYLSGGSGS